MFQIQRHLISAARRLEYVYASAMIFALTQGPIYKLWRTSETYSAVPMAPTWQSSFFIVQIPAIMILARCWDPRRINQKSSLLLGAFCGWMLVSTCWTNLSRYVLVDSLALMISAMTGLYFGSRFSVKEALCITWAGTQIGVLISYFAIKQSWTESVDSNGNWVGIYFNRNSLGPVALIALVAGLATFVTKASRKIGAQRTLAVSVLGVMMAINITTLVRTRSITPLMAFLGAGVGVASWSVVVRFLKNRARFSKSAVSVARLWFISTAVFAVWLVFKFQDAIGQAVGSNDIFSGRSAFWNFSWTGFLERPVIGWGWRAAWFTPEFLKREMFWTTAGSNWSHNGYLEILLGGGVIGFALFTSYAFYAINQLLTYRGFSSDSRWRLGATFFVLAASTQEVFIIGNHFLWVILIAALCAPQSDEDYTSPS